MHINAVDLNLAGFVRRVIVAWNKIKFDSTKNEYDLTLDFAFISFFSRT